MTTPQLVWVDPTPDDRSMPWRQLSPVRLERRVLYYNGKETKLQVITSDPRADEYNIEGRIVYIVRPTPDKGQKDETRFHVTAYDNLVRGAGNAYTNLQRRSDQMAEDEQTLQIICQLIGFNWEVVKQDPLLRLMVAGSLSPMSVHYARARRKRLQVVAARTGSSVNIKDSKGRDNKLITVTKLFWSRPGLVAQKGINDRAVNAAADREDLSLELRAYVEALLTNLVAAADTGAKGKFMRSFRKLEEIAIFNPLVHGVKYCHNYMTQHRTITPEVMDHVASVLSAERLLCGLSELISLVRDEPELRVPSVFEQMRELVDWDQFDPTYSAIAGQLRGEIDELQALCTSRPRLVRAQSRNIKSIIRDRRPYRTKQLLKAHEEFQLAS